MWKFFLRAREPSRNLAREELHMLDQELPLEELIYFRMRCAMSHSDHLRTGMRSSDRGNEYAKRLVPLLNALKINPHVPLHRNEEAVIRGKQVWLLVPTQPTNQNVILIQSNS